MGISTKIALILEDLKVSGAFDGFLSVLEMGTQKIKAQGVNFPTTSGLYYSLGFTYYECIDAGGGGTLKADLNKPISLSADTFDLITNFGTAEHVFNQFQFFDTIHRLCRNGGMMVHALPTQGWDGHGLYTYHTGFLRELAVANRYKVEYLESVMHSSGVGYLTFGALRKASRSKHFKPSYDPAHIKTCKVTGYSRQKNRRETTKP